MTFAIAASMPSVVSGTSPQAVARQIGCFVFASNMSMASAPTIFECGRDVPVLVPIAPPLLPPQLPSPEAERGAAVADFFARIPATQQRDVAIGRALPTLRRELRVDRTHESLSFTSGDCVCGSSTQA